MQEESSVLFDKSSQKVVNIRNLVAMEKDSKNDRSGTEQESPDEWSTTGVVMLGCIFLVIGVLGYVIFTYLQDNPTFQTYLTKATSLTR